MEAMQILRNKVTLESRNISRKGLAIDALNNMKKFFLNRRLSVDLKCRLFNSYISSIFLYNSEIWTLNVNDEKLQIHLKGVFFVDTYSITSGNRK